ncbi:MAG TPA: 50S ribosomal protein L35 [Candidatus Eisenbacteria bacterium]|nr:50S ribosomal protein L35 [Candidatus Eisenbacteria bacterium]
MPKMKTNRAARKRFKISGTGKAIRRASGLRHGMISDNRISKRRKGSNLVVAAADQARVLRMLGQR